MSESQRASATPTNDRGYRRDNYFAGDDYDDKLSSTKGHPDQHPAGTPKHQWVAKSVLKNGATFIDPTLFDSDDVWLQDAVPIQLGECVELSEPQFHVVADDSREGPSGYDHPKRVNEELGTLVGGGTIKDRPFEEFMACVDAYLHFLRHSRSGTDMLGDREIEKLREEARWLKQHDDRDLHDTEIVAELSRAVDWQQGVEDYFS